MEWFKILIDHCENSGGWSKFAVSTHSGPAGTFEQKGRVLKKIL
jgi:hypothetical protein